jgi:hypothetical protein
MSMRIHSLSALLLVSAALVASPAVVAGAAGGAAPEKARLIVLTDLSEDPDDQESLVRLLVYSNEIDIQGMLATTSVWSRDRVSPQIIRGTVAAYGKVRDNLLLHAPGFPTAETLLQTVKACRPELGMAAVGDGKSNDGSRLIVSVVDQSDPRPVWIGGWGGVNCLAQALWDVRRDRSPAQVAAFVAKLRVYAISDQDDAGYWLRRTFPELFYIVSPTTVEDPDYIRATWTGISSKSSLSEHIELVENPWLTQHIREHHGPLGERYPPLKYIMEGDTPSFLNLIPNGLASQVSPAFGGWGGRYELRTPHGETRPIWTNSLDVVKLATGQDFPSDQATIWRWREAYQDDFAARMDWTVQPAARANHNPIAVVNGSAGQDVLELTVKAGENVTLDATGSHDPDNDLLSYHWFYYPEAGQRPQTFKPRPTLGIDGAQSQVAHVTLPKVTAPEQFHVILELKDNGAPPLYSYRRVILTAVP